MFSYISITYIYMSDVYSYFGVYALMIGNDFYSPVGLLEISHAFRNKSVCSAANDI